MDIIGQGIGTTFQLGIGALVFALAFSIPLGIISALKQNSIVDYLSMLIATIGTTIPGFVLAIFLIYIFGVSLHLLPFVGWGSWQHMVMPMFVLGLGAGGFLTRITRASMLEAIRHAGRHCAEGRRPGGRAGGCGENHHGRVRRAIPGARHDGAAELRGGFASGQL